MFLHELDNWTDFRWSESTIDKLNLEAMHRLGYLAGRMDSIGFDTKLVATVEAVTNDVVSSSEIEGIRLDTDEVRSSVARKLGVDIPKSKEPTHFVDGIVEMMLDATINHTGPLTKERLSQWHRALFPNQTEIKVGEYRTGEMSVVSGTFGREKLHYRAPAPERVPFEMERFLLWLNDPANMAGILKSAIAHLWFVSIHPFDDGNGRIGRAISDMIMADLDGDGMHFYSLSRRILQDKKHYYKVLEQTQRGNGDITEWLVWYLNAFMFAIEDSNTMLSQVLRKARFWLTHSQTIITERQRKVMNTYLDGYEGKLTAKNWEKIAGVKKDTALRDIDALVKQGILIPTPGRVRDIPYSINYTSKSSEEIPFTNIEIREDGAYCYISAVFKGNRQLRDRLSSVDLKRFNDKEIDLNDLAYKYFAYVLD